MEYRAIAPAEAKEQALRLLKNTLGRSVTLATIGAEGYPDLRPLALCAHDGLDSLWFGTARTTRKVAQLKDNPHCTVHVLGEEGGMEFRLFGSMKLLNDSASRRRIWQDEFLRYFPDGVDSPELLVLQLVAVRGEYRAFTEMGPVIGEFSL